jgi:hypothetical protein
MQLGAAPVWEGSADDLDAGGVTEAGHLARLRAWRVARDRKKAWEALFVVCLQRIGWVVIREPIEGRVIQLKRPMWLKAEDRA